MVISVAPDPSTQTYQEIKPYLFSVAYRFTGSASESEDLVQDAWLRYLDAGSPSVQSLRAYLTTIVSRLSLDYLKSARVKRVQYHGDWLPEPLLTDGPSLSPELAWEQREAISMAMLTLLDKLTPNQRVVYVLRESLDLPFEEIAQLLDRTPASCRQLFHRAQRLLAEHDSADELRPSDRVDDAVSERFFRALEQANAGALASLLSEDVVWISDAGSTRLSTRNPVFGIDRVSRGLAGSVTKWYAERPVTTATINGSPAIIYWLDGDITTVLQFHVHNGQITRVWFSRSPEKLSFIARQLGVKVAPTNPEPNPRRSGHISSQIDAHQTVSATLLSAPDEETMPE